MEGRCTLVSAVVMFKDMVRTPDNPRHVTSPFHIQSLSCHLASLCCSSLVLAHEYIGSLMVGSDWLLPDLQLFYGVIQTVALVVLYPYLLEANGGTVLWAGTPCPCHRTMDPDLPSPDLLPSSLLARSKMHAPVQASLAVSPSAAHPCDNACYVA